MRISVYSAWIATILSLLLALKYFIRKKAMSGNKKGQKINRIMRKPHIYIGFAALVAALLHGIFAGNPSFSTLSDFAAAPLLFSWNTGVFCFILLILLALSWIFRKTLKKSWLSLHRTLTVMMLCVLICHITENGITLFKLVFPTALENTSSYISDNISDSDSSGEKDNNSDNIDSSEINSDTVSDAVSSEITLDSDESEIIVMQTKFAGAVLYDGEYQGSGNGYRGPIDVSVSVENGAVTQITVLSYSDNEEFFLRAEASVLSEIIDNQALNADAVTGATFSSNGLINAVADALSGAVAEGELELPTLSQPSQRH